MYPLPTLFACFGVWFVFVSFDMTIDVISMIALCKLCKLDKALIYQQSFGIVYIFPMYAFLVSHCYTWNKKTVNNQ